jgi:tyrosine-protein kinase
MTIHEILSVLWHRKLIVIGVLVIAIVDAAVALHLITPRYQSTATLALTPAKLGNDLLFLQTLDPVVSIYASAAETHTTRESARERLGGRLADISVRTFRDTPIMKIDARDPSPALAEQSALAVSNVLLARVSDGTVGVPGLKIKLIDRPTLPDAPYYPSRKLTYAIACLLGLAFGIAAALLWENLGRRVRTRDDLGEVSSAPVFAEIPLAPRIRKLRTLGAFIADPDLRTVSESLRDLRTNLLFAESSMNSVVVTSPEGRHGKTTVAAGLAVTLARSGARTILLDADLHRGRLAEMLGINRTPGLRDVLEGRQLKTALRESSITNLHLITSGPIGGDPSELLASRFPAIFQQLVEEYEVVVIDAPPLAPLNDARVIASLADTTILVAAAGKVSYRSVRDAVERLKLVAVVPTAAVLNMSRSRQSRAYYGPLDRNDRAGSTTAPAEAVEPENDPTPVP